MSMEDRTNQTIPLSMHKPLDEEMVHHAAEIYVDHDSDSSFTPAHWVDISLTDVKHDSDTIRLTEEEAGLLHDRLGLILSRDHAPSASVFIEAELGRDEGHAVQLPRYIGPFESDEAAHAYIDSLGPLWGSWSTIRAIAPGESDQKGSRA